VDHALKGQPYYVDYAHDIFHGKELPLICKFSHIQNIMLDLADSRGLESVVFSSVKGLPGSLMNMKECTVVIHYRSGQSYEPFKPTEIQMLERLRTVKEGVVARIEAINADWEESGLPVRLDLPEIVLETCKPCYRRRGGIDFHNHNCKGHL
jgi:hypothetical protein